MSDTIKITRKYTLIPTSSEYREWIKRIMAFMQSFYTNKIKYYEGRLEKETDATNIEKINSRLNTLHGQLKEFEESGEITQKNINDYTYDLIRRVMESESCRKNAIISYVIMELINCDAANMEIRDRNKLINELTSYGCRVKKSKKGSLLNLMDIDNPLGGYGVSFSKILGNDIKTMVNSKHVLEGKNSIVTYKSDSPFSISKSDMSFSHNYDTYEELCEHIREKDCNLYFNFGHDGNPTIARFKINLGANRKNKDELIATMLKVISGEYKFCGSSIGIEKNKIILNLSLDIPKQIRQLDENTVVGVDLGIAVPAMCALNNNLYERIAIGSADDFLRMRTKLQSQRKRLQKTLKTTSGGHGRKKKLKALERVKKQEAHFVETYCHMISKNVVDFALKHNAKYINVENLTGYDTSDFILRNWSYYKLQEYITYKAAKYDIEVRKINPCYTSQICSVCGNWEYGQRKSQSVFECANENCDSHTKYKHGFNADFNAARNIAKSTLWMESGQVTEKSKQEAREYYGIAEKYEELNKVA